MSQLSAGNVVVEFFPVLGAVFLLPHLYHAAVALLGSHHGVALGNAVGGRFLHIHVFSCGAGVGHDEAVPVVGGADDDGIDVFVVQHLAVVAVLPGADTPVLLGVGGALVEDLLVHVAQGHQPHTGILEHGGEVGPPHVAAADESHVYGIVSGHGLSICR